MKLALLFAAPAVVAAYLLLALPAEAHAPPLERLPAIVAAQADPGLAPATPEQTAELTNTESTLLKVVGLLAVPLATLLAAVLAMLTKKLQGEGKSNAFAHGAGVVLDLLASQLALAKAELAPVLQEALADGVLTPDERKALKAKLLEFVLKNAPADAMRALQATFGGAFGSWLEGKAEQAIDAMAAERGVSGP